MKNKSGFSLIELIVAIIIVAILSLVSVAVYRGYVERATETEARAMLGELHAAQQIYYIRNKQYLNDSSVTSETSNNSSLGVDFRKNKYFTAFKVLSAEVTNGVASFSVQTNSYKDKSYKIVGGNTAEPQVYKSENNGSAWTLIN